MAVGLPKRAPADQGTHWVGTWAASPQLGDATNGPPAPGFAGSTLRQIVHVSVGGKRIRLRISNEFGSRDLTIPAVHIAAAAGGSKIKPETDKALVFDNKREVTIPAGASMLSDPIDFELPALSDLAITIQFQSAPNEITTHPGARTTSYLRAGDAVAAMDIPGAAQIEHWYFISGVDVLTPATEFAVAALGDSITDGRNSGTSNGRWTDNLARRLQGMRNSSGVGVLNEGIGGNRLLHDGLGPNALARLDRDVIAQSGVRWLIVLEGINDLGTRASGQAGAEESATADRIIAAYRQIISRAHTHGIRVYGATIMPYGGSSYFRADGERDRQTINNWIRRSKEFDAVIDFDAATRDPQLPSRLATAVDSGDHLHPGVEGYKIMANSIDPALFGNK